MRLLHASDGSRDCPDCHAKPLQSFAATCWISAQPFALLGLLNLKVHEATPPAKLSLAISFSHQLHSSPQRPLLPSSRRPSQESSYLSLLLDRLLSVERLLVPPGRLLSIWKPENPPLLSIPRS